MLRDRDADSDPNTGDLGLSGSGLDERLYALQDANWNVVAIVGYDSSTSQWEVQERYTYTAYGKAEYRDPTTFALRNPNASTLGWTILYTGCNLDVETGLQINRRRYHHPDLGRFIVVDFELYDAGDVNLYRYCGNNPLTRVDPHGLEANWHHLLPRQFIRDFERAGIKNIHDADFGWILDKKDHGGIHPDWNKEWGKFFEGGKRTRAQILEQLECMKKEPKFKKILVTGKPATTTYGTWSRNRLSSVTSASKTLRGKAVARGADKVAKGLAVVGALAASGALAEAAFANGADAELDAAIKEATAFARRPSQAGALGYFSSMHALMTKVGLPAGLEGVRRRFERWRRTRKGHARIPDALWVAAVRAASVHGLNRTVQALRLDYYSLKERVERQAGAARDPAARAVAGRRRPSARNTLPK